jgi:hypothetical protein
MFDRKCDVDKDLAALTDEWRPVVQLGRRGHWVRVRLRSHRLREALKASRSMALPGCYRIDDDPDYELVPNERRHSLTDAPGSAGSEDRSRSPLRQPSAHPAVQQPRDVPAAIVPSGDGQTVPLREPSLTPVR